MTNIEYEINIDHALIELKVDQLSPEVNINITNSSEAPTNILYLSFPGNINPQDFIEVKSKFNFSGEKFSEVVLLLKSNTKIFQNDFSSFNSIIVCSNEFIKDNDAVYLQGKIKSDKYFHAYNLKTSSLILYCKGSEIINPKILGTLYLISSINNSVVKIASSNVEKAEIGSLIVDMKEPGSFLELNKLKFSKGLTGFVKNKILARDIVAGFEGFNIRAEEEIDMVNFALRQEELRLSSPKLNIGKFLLPRGKIYLNPYTYLNFETHGNDTFRAPEMIIDMRSSQNKRVYFPWAGLCNLVLENLEIYTDDEVSIQSALVVRNAKIIGASKISIAKINADQILYQTDRNKVNTAFFSTGVINNLQLDGIIQTFFQQEMTVNNINGNGLISIVIYDKFSSKMIKLNTNLDASGNSPEISKVANFFGIDIYNNGTKDVNIGTIIAKLSSFCIEGSAKIDTVILRQIDSRAMLLKIELKNNSKVKIAKFILGLYDIFENSQGTIEYRLRPNRLLTDGSNTQQGQGNIYAMIEKGSYQDAMHMHASNSLVFTGNIDVANGSIAMKAQKDLVVQGNLSASQYILLGSSEGSVLSNNSSFRSQGLLTMARMDTSFVGSNIEAVQAIIYSLEGVVQLKNTEITAGSLTIISEENDLYIENSSANISAAKIASGGSAYIANSELIANSVFLKSVADFVQYKASINIHKYPHKFFSRQIEAGSENSLVKVGIPLLSSSNEVSVVGIVSNNQRSGIAGVSYKMLSSKHFSSFEIQNDTIPNGVAYIEVGKGTIIGSNINADVQVIIKSRTSIEIIPIVLYNSFTKAGFTEQGIKQVIGEINAGKIDIEAGTSVNLIGAVLNAVVGTIKGEFINLLASPEYIKIQQERYKALQNWEGNHELGKLINPHNTELNFTEKTALEASKGKVDIYYGYKSKELYLKQATGDILVDKPINYEVLAIEAGGGKIIVGSNMNKSSMCLTSQEITNIYGGGDKEPIIGGKHVYLIADEVTIYGGDKINVEGTLKIVGKNGVHFIPVAVHERLITYAGKYTAREDWVHQLVSEINAGLLDIESDKAVNIIGSVINAIGVKLKAEALSILPATELYERQAHFQNSKSWGRSKEWSEHVSDSVVVPTKIKADSFYANISGKTTVEAAQALIEKDAFFKTGEAEFKHSYNIHVRDFAAKTNYLMKCSDGKLQAFGQQTVQEMFEGRMVVPTIFCVGGVFYGTSSSKLHILGSKIIGNDIYLIAPEGVKLEAATNYSSHLVMINESGARLRFKANSGELAVIGEIFTESSKKQVEQTLQSATSIVAKNNLYIDAGKKDVEQISSEIIWGNKAKITARNFIQSVKENVERITGESMTANLGISAGVKSNIPALPGKMLDLLAIKGTNGLDFLNRALQTYAVGKEGAGALDSLKALGSLLNNSSPQEAVKGIMSGKAGSSVQMGVNVNAAMKRERTYDESRASVSNVMQGGDLSMEIESHTRFHGINMEVENLDLHTKTFEALASTNSRKQEYDMGEIGVSIPITGNIPPSVNASHVKSEKEALTYNQDFIKVRGKMRINIEEDGRISGVSFEAKHADINATNLIVESLQDVIAEKMSGLNMSVGLSGDKLNLGFKGEKSERNANLTKALGEIIGNEFMRLTVKETLELTGARLANAEKDAQGNLTDKGKAVIEAGAIAVNKLYDYDKGKTIGAGLYYALATGGSGGSGGGGGPDPDDLPPLENVTTGAVVTGESGFMKVLKGIEGVPVKYGFTKTSKTVNPVIGGTGSFKVGGKEVGAKEVESIEGLGRDIGAHFTDEKKYRSGEIDASIPVGDISSSLSKLMEGGATGVASGNEQKDFWKSLQDYVKGEKEEEEEEEKHQAKDYDNSDTELEMKNFYEYDNEGVEPSYFFENMILSKSVIGKLVTLPQTLEKWYYYSQDYFEVKFNAETQSNWHDATYENKTNCIQYHLEKHGRGRTIEEYTEKAMKFYEKYKHQGEGVKLRDGTEGIKIKIKDSITKKTQGGYWTKDGKIVTFFD